MKKQKILNLGLLTILVIGIAIISGCVQKQSETGTLIETKKLTTDMQPSELVLNLSDFPVNYSLKERTPLLKSDVKEESIKLGWKEGYKVTYVTSEDIFDVTVVIQQISLYPKENISKALEIPKNSTEDLLIEEIPCSNIGDKCRSWRVTAKDEFGKQNIFYRLDFIKMDVHEFLFMGGTIDYDLLKDLAKKANSKIK